MSLQVREQLDQVLSHLLQHGDEADRCYAARAAGEIRVEGSLQPLLDCLYHEDADVCIDAADALAQLKRDEAIPRLVEVVEQHPEGDAKVSAANALAQLDDERAHKALLSWALGNPSQNNADFPSDWDDWWDIQLNAINALANQGRPEAVSVLKQVLSEEPLDIESDLLRALTLCGEEGVDYVIELLQGSHARLARRAAAALRHAQCENSLIALFKALRNESGDIRGMAAEALGQRQAKQYFIDLVQLLNDPLAEVRSQALAAAESMLKQLQAHHLKHISPEKLTQILPTLDAEGRALLLNALSRMLPAGSEPEPALIEAIRQGIASDNAAEVEAAALLLQTVPVAEAKEVLLQRLLDDSLPLSSRCNLVNGLKALAGNHRDYLVPLNRLLNEDNAALRQIVLEALAALAQLPAQHTGIAAQELLELCLNDQQVSEEQLLAEVESEEPAEGMIPCVMVNDSGEAELPKKEPSENDRMAAIMAQFGDAYPTEEELEQVNNSAPRSTLDAINQANIQAALQTTTATEDSGLGEHIREMVDELPDEMDEFGNIVVGHLDSGEKLKLSRKKIAPLPDYTNQILAIRALGKIVNEEAVERLLLLLLETEPQILQETINSLGQIAARDAKLKALTKVVGPLSTLLLGGTDQIRQLSARTLGLVGHRTAMPILTQALQDEESNVRIESIRALEQLFFKQVKGEAGELVWQHKPAPQSVLNGVKACLQDPVDGVVLAAFTFLSHEKAEEKVAEIVDLGLGNSALTAAAAKTVAKLDPQVAAQQLLQPILEPDFAEQRPKALQMLTILAEQL
ncbi:HEAT repeat domain-containing protein [Amphritea sp. HPY]|uniref:HEAT repeat domain-containing protein n=1 Tax=Amphritea sp. HPY TaxID=3421652 RepID=UPI003D7C74DE